MPGEAKRCGGQPLHRGFPRRVENINPQAVMDAGGIPARSRWLSEATPPVTSTTHSPIPAGMADVQRCGIAPQFQERNPVVLELKLYSRRVDLRGFVSRIHWDSDDLADGGSLVPDPPELHSWPGLMTIRVDTEAPHVLNPVVLSDRTNEVFPDTCWATMNTTDQVPPDSGASKSRGVFVRFFLALVALVNLAALAAAWQDRSWGALGIAIGVGPTINAILIVFGLVAIPFLKRRSDSFSLGRHLALSIGIPIAAIVADFLIISSMGLHGC